MITPEKLTVRMVEDAIKVPARKWEGKCHEIALKINKAKLVKGRVAYGLWWGVKKGYWEERSGVPFTHHGWIVLPDGRILDPTRWSFEAAEPYIWVGWPCHDYDEGGNRARMESIGECPEYDESDKKVTIKLSKPAMDFVMGLLGDTPAITLKQLGWLANLSPESFEGHVVEVYQAIIDTGWSGFIPIDNRRLVMAQSG